MTEIEAFNETIKTAVAIALDGLKWMRPIFRYNEKDRISHVVILDGSSGSPEIPVRANADGLPVIDEYIGDGGPRLFTETNLWIVLYMRCKRKLDTGYGKHRRGRQGY